MSIISINYEDFQFFALNRLMKELSGQIKKRSRGPKPKKNFLSVIGPKTNPDPKVRKKIPKFRYSGTP